MPLFERGSPAVGRRVVAASLAAGCLAWCATAKAETIPIIALGASNAYAQAVPVSEAWPAKLEAILRAKGYDVSVTVKAVSVGDATQILNAVDSSVPAGTKVVVFDTGGGNSADRGINPASVRPQIEQRIRAHGAKPVFAAYARIIGPEKGNSAWIQGDAHHHFTVQSHSRIAAALAPQVMAAIGKKK